MAVPSPDKPAGPGCRETASFRASGKYRFSVDSTTLAPTLLLLCTLAKRWFKSQGGVVNPKGGGAKAEALQSIRPPGAGLEAVRADQEERNQENEHGAMKRDV